MKPSDFLMEVWGEQCRIGDYVFLSVKSASGWVDLPFVFSDGIQGKLDSSLEKHDKPGNHLYFCPLPFKGPNRRKGDVLRSSFLWSDLDDAADTKKFTPSILWESSPGRFQGLWRMDAAYAPSEAERLSKQAAYAVGADKGGWDLTQVLRIPGTRNHKYDPAPTVKLIHNRAGTFRTADVPLPRSELPKVSADEILRSYGKTIPRKLLNQINDRHPKVGARSEVLWSIENQLVELGLTDPEIIAIVKGSSWNKYEGRRDEDERLTSELRKIRESAGTVTPVPRGTSKPREPSGVLKSHSYAELMAGLGGSPGWMVNDFWMKRSHGIVAGEPKSFKSTLVLDMAFSVASATSFLGTTAPTDTGPIVYVNNENAGWILKDRFEKLSAARGKSGLVKHHGDKLRITFPEDLPLYFVNQQGFSFDDPLHVESIEKLVADIKPALVIFDPLYLMLSGDVNSAKDLSEHLNWLLQLKQENNCGICLIHHWNKNGNSSRGGQRMLGSTTLHGWIESAWYLESTQPNNDKDPVRISMEREFRGAAAPPKLDIKLLMGKIGDPQYQILLEEQKSLPIREDIINLLETSTTPLSKRQLKMKIGASQRVIAAAVQDMLDDGTLEQIDGKVKLGGKKE